MNRASIVALLPQASSLILLSDYNRAMPLASVLADTRSLALAAASLLVVGALWSRIRGSFSRLSTANSDLTQQFIEQEVRIEGLEYRLNELTLRIDEMQYVVDFVDEHWAFIREMWNSHGTLWPMLHPRDMEDSYRPSGTAEQAENGVANIFSVCYNPAVDQFFFRPTALINQLS